MIDSECKRAEMTHRPNFRHISAFRMEERTEETHASHRLITYVLSRPDQFGEYHCNCRRSQIKELYRCVTEVTAERQICRSGSDGTRLASTVPPEDAN
jgi:hypothetical protein